MYQRILVPLENKPSDKAILPHVTKLARLHGSQLILFHVADGWAARNFDKLKLAESDEIRADREYLEELAASLRTGGLVVDTKLAMGDPPREIVRMAEAEHCDLIAMTSHGHRFFGDLFHGSTINEVRHATSIPVLLVREREG